MKCLWDDIERAKSKHEQLVLVVGDYAAELLKRVSDTDQLPVMNIGKELSSKLLDVPSIDHPKVAANLFAELVAGCKNTQVLLMDHLEILFDRSLFIDPLKLLQACAKSITLVVVWPGMKTSSSLLYATPNHPEYRLYKEPALNGLIFIEAKTHKELT